MLLQRRRPVGRGAGGSDGPVKGYWAGASLGGLPVGRPTASRSGRASRSPWGVPGQSDRRFGSVFQNPARVSGRSARTTAAPSPPTGAQATRLPGRPPLLDFVTHGHQSARAIQRLHTEFMAMTCIIYYH